jgi:hypothetical protein
MNMEASEEWKNRSRVYPVDITIGFIDGASEDLINYDHFYEMIWFRRCWKVDSIHKVYDAQEWCLSMLNKDMDFFKEKNNTEFPDMVIGCVIGEPTMTKENIFTWHRGWIFAKPTQNAYKKFLATGRELGDHEND